MLFFICAKLRWNVISIGLTDFTRSMTTSLMYVKCIAGCRSGAICFLIVVAKHLDQVWWINQQRIPRFLLTTSSISTNESLYFYRHS